MASSPPLQVSGTPETQEAPATSNTEAAATDTLAPALVTAVELPELPLKPGPGTKTKEAIHRRNGYQKKAKKEMAHGSWKLVYADFVTVLMAFFIVVWVMLFDNISKRERIDTSCIEPVAKELKEMIQGDAGLQSGKMPFDIDYSSEGLRITLKDAGEPLFQRGGTTLSDFAKKQFQKIASVANKCPTHKLKIEGYTDAEAYAGGTNGYSNWELSAERANSARRELIAEKVPIDRIAQVIGYGDSVPSMPQDPTNPLNRRISITVIPPKIKGEVKMGGMSPL
jgi:flagellar motor protein MotB